MIVTVPRRPRLARMRTRTLKPERVTLAPVARLAKVREPVQQAFSFASPAQETPTRKRRRRLHAKRPDVCGECAWEGFRERLAVNGALLAWQCGRCLAVFPAK